MSKRDRNFSSLFFFCFVGEEVKEVKRRGEEKVRPRIARTSRPRNLEDARQTHESADSSLPTHQRLAECEVKARVKRSRKEKQETKQKNTSRFASRREEEEEQEEEEEKKSMRNDRAPFPVLTAFTYAFSMFAVAGFRSSRLAFAFALSFFLLFFFCVILYVYFEEGYEERRRFFF